MENIEELILAAAILKEAAKLDYDRCKFCAKELVRKDGYLYASSDEEDGEESDDRPGLSTDCDYAPDPHGRGWAYHQAGWRDVVKLHRAEDILVMAFDVLEVDRQKEVETFNALFDGWKGHWCELLRAAGALEKS